MLETLSSENEFHPVESHPSFESIVFRTVHRAQFDEIDPFGHLNNARYLNYLNQHRFEGMRSVLNLTIQDISSFSFAFYTQKFEINFKKPILMDQEFSIKSSIVNLGNSSASIYAEFFSGNGSHFADAKITLVCVDKLSKQTTPWPDSFLEIFFRQI